ncbi:phosphotransferase [Kribbella deserti]|uniref:Phosphotransferase n=1 Tax=Kribbella deserti TaxID=1926257 RepID=A0ABV6QXM6_9ACTN
MPADAEPFASGRDADVYAVGADRVLRRYRAGGDVAPEAELMRYAAAHGYPVPEVFVADGPDLLMQRLDGPTLLQAALSGRLGSREVGELLAELQNRLHALPVPSGRPGLSLVHGDFHPENVILTGAGPMVIDWRNAAERSPGFDIATTAIILGQVHFDPAYSAVSALVRDCLTSYLEAAPDPTPELPAALAARAADPAVGPVERDRLEAVEAFIRNR